MTIKRKFGAYLLVVLAVIAVVALVTGRSIRSHQRTQAIQSIDAAARLEARRVEDTLNETARRLASPALEAMLVPALEAQDAETPGSSELVEEALAQAAPFMPALRAGTVLDATGAPLAATAAGEATDEPRPIDSALVAQAIEDVALGAPFVAGPAFRAAPGEERFVLVVPLGEASRPAGYLVAECAMQPLQDMVARSAILGETAEANLVQATGEGAMLVTHPRFDQDAAFELIVPLSSQQSAPVAALTRPAGTYSDMIDYRGTSVIASFEHVSNSPWALLLEVDTDEVFGPLNRAIMLGGVAFAAAGAAALLLLGLLFRSLLARIGRVSESAAAISAGDLTSRVNDRTPDELGRLARAFDRMTDTLVSDMASRHAVEQELAHRASHDPLTGLPNRDAFHQQLKQALRDRPTPGGVAALFCDLDDFKTVNDDLGHSAGDALLVGVAQRLRAAVGPEHVLARFGGDEFVIVARHVFERGQVARLAERIRDQLAEPLVLAGREVFVTTSIGIAFSRTGSTAETLIRDADAAMYRAKDLGRRRVVVHDESIGAQASNRLDMTTELRRAISIGGLTMVLQPIVDLETGGTRAWEALVRWVYEGREIDPSEFVTRATELDIAGELDRWVIDEASRIMRRLSGRASMDSGWLHVNVTGTSLVDPSFATDVLHLLSAHGVPASALCLEIIEDRFGSAPMAAFRTLNELRRHGAHVAIDDFGTGHSSLARLRDVPADTLKIDRLFVQDLITDPTAEVVTSMIIKLSQQLGLEAIAEGVESEAQIDALRRLGCRYAQGYALGAPQPAEDVVRLVEAH